MQPPAAKADLTTLRGVVLAAHGSRGHEAANALLTDHARRLGRFGLFDESAVAFHHGSPPFAGVLDAMIADDVTVVPVMTSEGYFCTTVLPRELARNKRFPRIRVRQTPPVGTHPDMVGIAARRVRRMLREFGLAASSTSLIIVGHGTRRHGLSRRSTETLSRKLARLDLTGEVLTAFLDDEPSVESGLRLARRPHVVVVPFLMTPGPHAYEDLPRRLGLRPSGGPVRLFAGSVANRFVVCDAPLGVDPQIVDVVASLAGSAGGRSWGQGR